MKAKKIRKTRRLARFQRKTKRLHSKHKWGISVPTMVFGIGGR